MSKWFMFGNNSKSLILQLYEHCFSLNFWLISETKISIENSVIFGMKNSMETFLDIFIHCIMVKRICKLRFNFRAQKEDGGGWLVLAGSSPSSSFVNNFWSLSITHEELASFCSSDARYDRTPTTAATAKSWFPNVFLSFGLLDVMS